mmetsp:Transcript_21812/g.70478  ORF Transcript_21812/g.70478 Transcript_21812/m.70478 type:complete len:243 (+) Transcript_21812:555-1283(+)
MAHRPLGFVCPIRPHQPRARGLGRGLPAVGRHGPTGRLHAGAAHPSYNPVLTPWQARHVVVRLPQVCRRLSCAPDGPGLRRAAHPRRGRARGAGVRSHRAARRDAAGVLREATGGGHLRLFQPRGPQQRQGAPHRPVPRAGAGRTRHRSRRAPHPAHHPARGQEGPADHRQLQAGAGRGPIRLLLHGHHRVDRLLGHDDAGAAAARLEHDCGRVPVRRNLDDPALHARGLTRGVGQLYAGRG